MARQYPIVLTKNLISPIIYSLMAETENNIIGAEAGDAHGPGRAGCALTVLSLLACILGTEVGYVASGSPKIHIVTEPVAVITNSNGLFVFGPCGSDYLRSGLRIGPSGETNGAITFEGCEP